MSQLSLYPELQKADDHVVNVASVRQYSPFRYPGGKTWLVPQVLKWIRKRHHGECPLFVEPFAGGGIVTLTIAATKLAKRCLMIERDDEIAAVWKTLIYGDAKWLAQRILEFDLTHETANEIIESTPKTTEEKAFRTILKNRTYHGGILAPGSGLLKNGENGKGIHSRWYPQTLANRILNILHFKDRIDFIEGDAFETIDHYKDDESTTFFIDPPYTASKKKAGSRLYRFHSVDHEHIFKSMHDTAAAFMLTYDDANEIRDLCAKYNLPFVRVPMKGTHHIKYHELLICDNIEWSQ